MKVLFPVQSDVPAGSLKFHYGLSDSNDSKGGFATISVSETTMTLTFFDDKGDKPLNQQRLVMSHNAPTILCTGNQLYSTSRPKIR